MTVLSNNSVAARLIDAQFASALTTIIRSTGLPCAITLLSRNSFSSRIVGVLDAFVALMEHVHKYDLRSSAVVKMLGTGKLNQAIPQLSDRLRQCGNKVELEQCMATYKGSYKHKNAMAKQLLHSPLPSAS